MEEWSRPVDGRKRHRALGAEGSATSVELLVLSAAASQGYSLWEHTLLPHTGTL